MSEKRSPRQRRADLILNYAYSKLSVVYGAAMTFLVGLVCIIFVATTYALPPWMTTALELADLCITILFLGDYILRWWAKGWSFRYLFTPLALIDLMTILPLFAPTLHWQFLRVFRLFRVLRLARFFQRKNRFFPNIEEYHLRQGQILFSAFCILFIYAGLMYEADKGLQIQNFGDAWYFSVVSLTTVGFGDISPQTELARWISVFMILTGVLLIPWQLASFGRFLVQQGAHRRGSCDGCGLEWHEMDARHCKRCGERLTDIS